MKEVQASEQTAGKKYFLGKYAKAFTSYWKESAKEFADTRKIALAGIMLAMSVALQLFWVPVDPSGSLRIQVTFIVSALSGVILGPLLSFVRGAGADVIGFLIFPQGGGFFPGYTLSSALGAMVYSLFFWKREISSKSILGAKITVNVFINAMLGSVWSVIYYGTKAYSVYFGLSFVKNLVMLPLEVLVITVLFRAMLPVMSKLNMIKSERFDLICVSKVQTIIACAVLAAVILLVFLFGGQIYEFLKNFVNLIFT